MQPKHKHPDPNQASKTWGFIEADQEDLDEQDGVNDVNWEDCLDFSEEHQERPRPFPAFALKRLRPESRRKRLGPLANILFSLEHPDFDLVHEKIDLTCRLKIRLKKLRARLRWIKRWQKLRGYLQPTRRGQWFYQKPFARTDQLMAMLEKPKKTAKPCQPQVLKPQWPQTNQQPPGRALQHSPMNSPVNSPIHSPALTQVHLPEDQKTLVPTHHIEDIPTPKHHLELLHHVLQQWLMELKEEEMRAIVQIIIGLIDQILGIGSQTSHPLSAEFTLK